jgi:hypothetical protein
MASEELKSISSIELFNNQIEELKKMKGNIEHLKNELITAQKNYEQRLVVMDIQRNYFINFVMVKVQR